jgi:nitroreductase
MDMNVADAITARRSVKRFDPDHRLTPGEVRRLMELTVLSPTAFNLQNWRFLLVEDPDLRRRLREAAFDQPQVTDASLLVVICADLLAWDRDPERYWRDLPPARRARMGEVIRGFYRGRAALQRDEAMRSCGLAAMTLMLAAREMGYDSCPMDGFDFQRVTELIGLPDDHVLALFVAVGRRLEDPRPRSGRLPLGEVVRLDRFA